MARMDKEVRRLRVGPRLGNWRLLTDACASLREQGYTVYKRGWPTIAAEKDGEMRLFVLNPAVKESPVVLGKGKDALNEAFKRCVGVGYEVWGNTPDWELEKKPRRWM